MIQSKTSVINENTLLMSLFMKELRSVYWAENELVKQLPEQVDAADSKELKSAFAAHLKITEGQIDRLKFIFSALDTEACPEKCKMMESIIKEGEQAVSNTKKSKELRDIGLIFISQKVMFYEISAYRILISLISALRRDGIKEILLQALAEGKVKDLRLFEWRKKEPIVQKTYKKGMDFLGFNS